MAKNFETRVTSFKRIPISGCKKLMGYEYLHDSRCVFVFVIVNESNRSEIGRLHLFREKSADLSPSNFSLFICFFTLKKKYRRTRNAMFSLRHTTRFCHHSIRECCIVSLGTRTELHCQFHSRNLHCIS